MSAASAAAALPQDAVEAVPKKSRKKLIVIGAAVLLVLALAGGMATWFLKKKAHAAQADVEAVEKVDRAHPPTFVPLDAFVVNLADKDVDRYAQIGITLEIDDAKFADQIKVYMPAIRNGVLMVLAHKTSRELLERSGKERLAAEILAAAVKPLGFDAPPPTVAAAGKADAGKPADDAAETSEAEADAEADKRAARKPASPSAGAEHNPVRRVHFSNFIIQ